MGIRPFTVCVAKSQARSDPKTGTVAGATDILESVTGTRARQRSTSRMSVMLKKKGVFDAMRPADGCCSLRGGPSSSVTRVVVSVSSGAYDSCLERPYASKALLKHAVETHRSHCPRFLQAPK